MSERENDTHSADVVFAWGGGSKASTRYTTGRERRESSNLIAEIYVRRGTDIQARDRVVRSNGEAFTVIGHGLWDQVQPMSGNNFGWKAFQVESYNG